MPNIRPDQYVFVSGTVTWSRITSLIDGEELKQSIKDSTSQFPTTVPHTRIAISNAVVKNLNPQMPTPEETYVESRLYESKDQTRYPGKSYNIDNRSPYLPALFRKGDPDKGENANDVYQIFSKHELAMGTPVLLVLHTYAGQANNNGIGLDAVIVRDKEVNFFVPGNAGQGRIAEALKKVGIQAHFAENNEAEPTAAEAAEIAAKTANVDLGKIVPTEAPQVPSLDAIEQPLDRGITLDGLLG